MPGTPIGTTAIRRTNGRHASSPRVFSSRYATPKMKAAPSVAHQAPSITLFTYEPKIPASTRPMR